MLYTTTVIDTFRKHDLKHQLDCRELYQRLTGQQPTSRGGTWWSFRAPHRTDRKPSLGITQDGFRDFATGERGDVFALIQLAVDCSFREAVKLATDLAGGVWETPSPRPTVQPSVHRKQVSISWQQAAEAVTRQAEQYLWSSRPDAARALGYLHKRGLTDTTIHHFHLGFLSTWTKTDYHKADGRPAYAAPGITIPRFDERGQLQKLNVRQIVGGLAEALGQPDQSEHKYLQLAGSNDQSLFVAGQLDNQLPIIFTEGEFDTLIGWQYASDLATFVTLGSASASLTEPDIQRLASAPLLLGCFDNDEAGQRGFQRLAGVLPISPAPLPTHVKDLSDFAVADGDVRTWVMTVLATAPIQIKGVPDGIRSAAFNCGVDAALAVYEMTIRAALTTFTIPELLATNQRFNLNLSESTIRRGIKQGTGIFFDNHAFLSNMDMDESNRNPDQGISVSKFERNPALCGKPTIGRSATTYMVLPYETVKAALDKRLPYRLLEKYFPMTAGSADIPLPLLQSEMLEAIGCEEADTLAGKLNRWLAAYHNGAEAQYLMRQMAAELKVLRAGLQSRHSSPVPDNWLTLRRYEALFLRSKIEQEPKNRTGRELALMTGRRRSSVKALLTRAGLKNERCPVGVIPLPSAARIVTAAAQAARGRGKILTIAAHTPNGELLEEKPFVPTELQPWADRLATTQAVSFSVRLAVAARQTVVGAVALPTPRNEVAEDEPAHRTRRRELDRTLHLRPARMKRHTDFTGLGHDPHWVKAVLLQYHQRVSGNVALVDTIQPLTLLEVLVGALEMTLMEQDPLLVELQRIHPTYALCVDI
jgi:hypothetical protein